MAANHFEPYGAGSYGFDVWIDGYASKCEIAGAHHFDMQRVCNAVRDLHISRAGDLDAYGPVNPLGGDIA